VNRAQFWGMVQSPLRAWMMVSVSMGFSKRKTPPGGPDGVRS
jgi:hypothetical protein